MWQVIILFLIPFANADNAAVVCSLRTETNIEMEWDESNKNELGSFSKNVEEGTQLPGIIIQSAKYESIQPGVECSYFTISQTNGTYVSIIATDKFENWDSNIAKSTCNFALIFDTSMCDNLQGNSPSRLNFYYSIIDVNLVGPKFNDEAYEMKLAFPIAAGVSLDCPSGVFISTNDTDFSTEKVTYTIDGGSEDFSLVALEKSGNEYPVKVKTKRLVHLQRPVNLTILAQDDGTNPKLPPTTVQLIITPDLVNTIPPTPWMTQTLYIVEGIKLEDLKVGYTLPVDINLKQEYHNVFLTTDHDDIFEVTREDQNIIVNVIQDINQDCRDSLNVVLTATIISGSQISQSSSVLFMEFSDRGNCTQQLVV